MKEGLFAGPINVKPVVRVVVRLPPRPQTACFIEINSFVRCDAVLVSVTGAGDTYTSSLVSVASRCFDLNHQNQTQVSNTSNPLL